MLLKTAFMPDSCKSPQRIKGQIGKRKRCHFCIPLYWNAKNDIVFAYRQDSRPAAASGNCILGPTLDMTDSITGDGSFPYTASNTTVGRIIWIIPRVMFTIHCDPNSKI
ncbi:MAG: hypothetical protein EBU46_09915 [Nitrosomonadaceae bacterium]|nr:hypothetical protein [Nitrosomonadaceae bacterium]